MSFGRLGSACRTASRIFAPQDFRSAIAPMTRMYCGVHFTGASTKSPMMYSFGSACGTPVFGFGDIAAVVNSAVEQLGEEASEVDTVRDASVVECVNTSVTFWYTTDTTVKPYS